MKRRVTQGAWSALSVGFCTLILGEQVKLVGSGVLLIGDRYQSSDRYQSGDHY